MSAEKAKFIALGTGGELVLAALVGATYPTAVGANDYLTAFAVANMLTWGAPVWMPIFAYCNIQDGIRAIRTRQAQDRMIAESLTRKKLQIA